MVRLLAAVQRLQLFITEELHKSELPHAMEGPFLEKAIQEKAGRKVQCLLQLHL